MSTFLEVVVDRYCKKELFLFPILTFNDGGGGGGGTNNYYLKSLMVTFDNSSPKTLNSSSIINFSLLEYWNHKKYENQNFQQYTQEILHEWLK